MKLTDGHRILGSTSSASQVHRGAGEPRVRISCLLFRTQSCDFVRCKNKKALFRNYTLDLKRLDIKDLA